MTGTRRWPCRLAALAIVGLLGSGPASSQDEDPEAALARVRAEIESLERDLARQIDRRDDRQKALRAAETSIAATRRELAGLEESVAEQRRKQQAIDADRARANRNLDDERAAFGQQVRMSYLTGRQELLKLMLSQESPTDFGRMLVYYDYLNRARGERIVAVNQELETLAQLAAESEAVAAELDRLQQAQQDRLARLDREQAERRRVVAELDAEIESGSDRVEQMRAEEAELSEVVERLAEILARFPTNSEAPFAEQRGELPWPVDGTVLNGFGKPREGGRSWDGVLLEAPAGAPVRAVYNGRVVYADWLSTYGLVLILEHGDGYMTLYGHNGALLRDVGDWVAPGEAIAEVGNSGGQAGPGLYFGIFRDGAAIDPERWIR